MEDGARRQRIAGVCDTFGCDFAYDRFCFVDWTGISLDAPSDFKTITGKWEGLWINQGQDAVSTGPIRKKSPVLSLSRAEQPGRQKKQEFAWLRVLWTQWYRQGHILNLRN